MGEFFALISKMNLAYQALEPQQLRVGYCRFDELDFILRSPQLRLITSIQTVKQLVETLAASEGQFMLACVHALVIHAKRTGLKESFSRWLQSDSKLQWTKCELNSPGWERALPYPEFGSDVNLVPHYDELLKVLPAEIAQVVVRCAAPFRHKPAYLGPNNINDLKLAVAYEVNLQAVNVEGCLRAVKGDPKGDELSDWATARYEMQEARFRRDTARICEAIDWERQSLASILKLRRDFGLRTDDLICEAALFAREDVVASLANVAFPKLNREEFWIHLISAPADKDSTKVAELSTELSTRVAEVSAELSAEVSTEVSAEVSTKVRMLHQYSEAKLKQIWPLICAGDPTHYKRCFLAQMWEYKSIPRNVIAFKAMLHGWDDLASKSLSHRETLYLFHPGPRRNLIMNKRLGLMARNAFLLESVGPNHPLTRNFASSVYPPLAALIYFQRKETDPWVKSQHAESMKNWDIMLKPLRPSDFPSCDYSLDDDFWRNAVAKSDKNDLADWCATLGYIDSLAELAAHGAAPERDSFVKLLLTRSESDLARLPGTFLEKYAREMLQYGKLCLLREVKLNPKLENDIAKYADLKNPNVLPLLKKIDINTLVGARRRELVELLKQNGETFGELSQVVLASCVENMEFLAEHFPAFIDKLPKNSYSAVRRTA